MKATGGNPRIWGIAAAACIGAAAAAAAGRFCLAACVLAGFVLLCIAGAVFARMQLFVPVIRRGPKNSRAVALTFDDGPDPETTPALLDLLARHNAPAFFFVTGRKAATHPELIRRMRAEGHGVGNHTWGHDVWITLKGAKALETQIAETRKLLMGLGIQPVFFRPPAGVVNPALKAILEKYEMQCILYSCRGPDLGNRRIRGLAGRIAKKIRGGDIVLLHDGHPASRGFDPEQWLSEMEEILVTIERKGLGIQPLSELAGTSGSSPAGQGPGPHKISPGA